MRACDAARERGWTGLSANSRLAGGNPSGTRVEYRKCPVCEAFMQRSNFRKRSGVIIDRCHSHGTWLDADELERIAGFILEGGMRADAEHYLMEQKIKAVHRREADALARAKRGESIAIDVPDRRNGFGGLLIDVLSDLLD